MTWNLYFDLEFLFFVKQITGLPHEKLFSITCEVEINGHTHTAIGGGKSKKNAKRFAAMKMIDILKGLNIYEEKEGQSKNGKKVLERSFF